MVLGLGSSGGRTAAAVDDQTCLSCHPDIMREVTSSRGLRFAHVTCTEGRACSDCHSETAHGSSVAWPRFAQMDACLECHSAIKAYDDCDTCHVERSSGDRLGSGAWAATHGATWQTTHGMGDDRTCAGCHPQDYCVRCHGVPLPHSADYVRLHPLQANVLGPACASCHERSFCDGCHGMEMPHPATFTALHPQNVREGGEAACLRCHVKKDCTTCHARHVHPGGAQLPPGGAL